MRQYAGTTAPLQQGLAIVAALALTACAADEESLSTTDIVARAEAYVRAELGLSKRAALFTDVFVPGYEDGELIVCGSVSGSRPAGPAIAPRRFIVALEPARWIAWEIGNSPHSMPVSFATAWTDKCRNPDDLSKTPLLPE